ncbi:MAG: hypothetical protein GF329_16585 [Candidatus Lokiarchaeota archaeon]|nr:hypothetical protein [Candidatus Lokiarchaeota archaeon]
MLSSVDIQAVIIADWQGLAMASKLPAENLDKEDLIAATTLFSLTGAEDTRKELQDSLLGKKLNYLLMMTDGGKYANTPYMVVCPIENLGYIACISNIREDMAILIMNMKKAADKAADILVPREIPQEIQKMAPVIDKVKSYQEKPSEDKRYNKILSKIRNLKKIQVSNYVPPTGLEKEAPVVKGNPSIPKQPPRAPKPKTVPSPEYKPKPPTKKFKSISQPPKSPKPSQIPQEMNNIKPQVPQQPVQKVQPQTKPVPPKRTMYKPPAHTRGRSKKFRVKFQTSKQIIFTMIVQAYSAEEAIKICKNRNPQFIIQKILETHEIS